MLFAEFCVFSEISGLLLFQSDRPRSEESTLFRMRLAMWSECMHRNESRVTRNFLFWVLLWNKILRKCKFVATLDCIFATWITFSSRTTVFIAGWDPFCCNDDVINVVLLLMSLRILAWGFLFWCAWIRFLLAGIVCLGYWADGIPFGWLHLSFFVYAWT